MWSLGTFNFPFLFTLFLLAQRWWRNSTFLFSIAGWYSFHIWHPPKRPTELQIGPKRPKEAQKAKFSIFPFHYFPCIRFILPLPIGQNYQLIKKRLGQITWIPFSSFISPQGYSLSSTYWKSIHNQSKKKVQHLKRFEMSTIQFSKRWFQSPKTSPPLDRLKDKRQKRIL